MLTTVTHRLGRLMLWVAAFCMAGPTLATPVWSDIVVFGDSLSDVGNVRQRSLDVTFGLFPQPDNRYDRGRFSNGDVWIERVADALGLDASTRSYRASGANYAYGGATTGPGSSNLTITRNVGWQVDEYLLRESRAPGPDTLVVLWAGGNNFLGGGSDTIGPADELVADLQRLFDAGGRHFLVPNLPPLGETPRFVNNVVDRANRNQLAAAHNAALAQRLDGFAAATGAEVYPLDVGTLFDQLLSDPAAFGITNTTGQAIGLPASADASGFLFWDDVHPTAAGHQRLADAALSLLLRLPGDYNGTGQVEQGDLDIVLQNWGTGTFTGDENALSGGGRFDGTVDQNELDAVLQNWGSTSATEFGGTELPEPSALILLTLTLHHHRPRGCNRLTRTA